MKNINWEQILQFFILVAAAATVLVKGVDTIKVAVEKKKNKALRDEFDAFQKEVQQKILELQDDVTEYKRKLEENTSRHDKMTSENREWIKKLEDDIDYLMKLLIDKSFKK